jgi:predicted NBD/HSP70 family sugar kinase
MPVNDRQRQIMRHLWRHGPISRSELSVRTSMTPNGVGAVVETMLRQGLLRERAAAPSGGGRPRVPVEIDPLQRHVVGLSFSPGRVEVARLSLCGQMTGTTEARDASTARQAVSAARRLLQRTVTPRSIAIGLSVTGFVDPAARKILFTSVAPDAGEIDLTPVYALAGNATVVLGNDMHAAGARWMLTHHADESQDVLLVSVDDGRLGASFMIDGRPNRGCVTAGNELGHTRLLVETERCYCGQVGCLERVVSTEFLRRLAGGNDGAGGKTLADRVARFDGRDAPLERVVELLATGLSNSVNLLRPYRLVLLSRFVRRPAFADLLLRSVRQRLLPGLVDRVRIDLWDQPTDASAENAGWLALAPLYVQSWDREPLRRPVSVRRAATP